MEKQKSSVIAAEAVGPSNDVAVEDVAGPETDKGAKKSGEKGSEELILAKKVEKTTLQQQQQQRLGVEFVVSKHDGDTGDTGDKEDAANALAIPSFVLDLLHAVQKVDKNAGFCPHQTETATERLNNDLQLTSVTTEAEMQALLKVYFQGLEAKQDGQKWTGKFFLETNIGFPRMKTSVLQQLQRAATPTGGTRYKVTLEHSTVDCAKRDLVGFIFNQVSKLSLLPVLEMSLHQELALLDSMSNGVPQFQIDVRHHQGTAHLCLWCSPRQKKKLQAAMLELYPKPTKVGLCYVPIETWHSLAPTAAGATNPKTAFYQHQAWFMATYDGIVLTGIKDSSVLIKETISSDEATVEIRKWLESVKTRMDLAPDSPLFCKVYPTTNGETVCLFEKGGLEEEIKAFVKTALCEIAHHALDGDFERIFLQPMSVRTKMASIVPGQFGQDLYALYLKYDEVKSDTVNPRMPPAPPRSRKPAWRKKSKGPKKGLFTLASPTTSPKAAPQPVALPAAPDEAQAATVPTSGGTGTAPRRILDGGRGRGRGRSQGTGRAGGNRDGSYSTASTIAPTPPGLSSLARAAQSARMYDRVLPPETSPPLSTVEEEVVEFEAMAFPDPSVAAADSTMDVELTDTDLNDTDLINTDLINTDPTEPAPSNTEAGRVINDAEDSSMAVDFGVTMGDEVAPPVTPAPPLGASWSSVAQEAHTESTAAAAATELEELRRQLQEQKLATQQSELQVAKLKREAASTKLASRSESQPVVPPQEESTDFSSPKRTSKRSRQDHTPPPLQPTGATSAAAVSTVTATVTFNSFGVLAQSAEEEEDDDIMSAVEQSDGSPRDTDVDSGTTL